MSESASDIGKLERAASPAVPRSARIVRGLGAAAPVQSQTVKGEGKLSIRKFMDALGAFACSLSWSPPEPPQEGERIVPEVRYSPSVLEALSYALPNPLGVLQWLQRQHGSIAKFTGAGDMPCFVASDPEVVRTVLLCADQGGQGASDSVSFVGDGAEFALGNTGSSIAASEVRYGQYAVIRPGFRRNNFESFELISVIRDGIENSARDLSDRIKRSASGSLQVELSDELSLITLRVALGSIFGQPSASIATLVKLRDALRVIHAAFPLEAVTPFDVPHALLTDLSAQGAHVVKSMQTLHRYAEAIIRSEEASPSKMPTVVTAMVEAMKTKTPLLSRNTVRHNIIALLLAGHEALSASLAFALKMCSQHSGMLEQVRSEASKREVMDARGLSDLEAALPITSQVLHEAMRLCPPLPALLRRSTQDVTMLTAQGNLIVPKGSEVLIDMFHAQRDADVWGVDRTGFPEGEFAPQRWSGYNLSKMSLTKQDLDAYMPSLHPHIFIGVHFAMAQGLLLLAKYATLFSISSSDRDRVGATDADATWRPGQRFHVEMGLL